MEIISFTQESYSFTDDKGNPYPSFQTTGCGCCSRHLPVTQENINKAIAQAEEWLSELRQMEPINYPCDVCIE